MNKARGVCLILLVGLFAYANPTPSPPSDATATKRGLVNTTSQTFSGLKTFVDGGILADLVPGTTFNGLPLSSSASETTGPLTLYISPDGGNTGMCTQTQPCQTLNGAFRRVPKNVLHAVRITPAAGMYPPEFSIFEGTITGDGYVEVVGSMEPWDAGLSADGGVMRLTGTLTSVGTTYPFMTATDSTQNWATDSAKGAHVRFTPDGGLALVLSNSSDTLVLTGQGSGKLHGVGDAYELVTPAVTFQHDAGTTGNAAVIELNLAGRAVRTQGLSTAGLPTLGRFTLQYVRLLNSGTFFSGIRAQSVGPRIEFLDSTSEGGAAGAGLQVFGPVTAFSCGRSLLDGKGSGALTVSNAPLYTLQGPCWFRGGAQTGSLRAYVGASTSTNFVFETTSATAAALSISAFGTFSSNASASNTGIIALCPAASTGQGVRVGFAGTSIPSPYGGFSTPALTVRNCRNALYVDGRSSALVGQLFNYATDGGSSNLVVDSRIGSYVKITPAPTISGPADELALDGVVIDGGFTTLNAATPQVLSNSYGSYILR